MESIAGVILTWVGDWHLEMSVVVSGHLAVTTIGSGAGALRNRLVLPTLEWCLPLEACD